MGTRRILSGIVLATAIAMLAPATASAAKHETCQNGNGSGGYDEGRPDPCSNNEDDPPPPPVRKRIVVSASVATLPVKYQRGYKRRQVAYCGFLRIRDNEGHDHRGDGIPEITFSWSIPGMPGRIHSARGEWDGENIVPTRPIPRIAAMTTQGANINSGGKYDRQLCGAPDKRLRMRTTDDSMRGVRVEYRNEDQEANRPLLDRFNVDDWHEITSAFQQAVDRWEADRAQHAIDAAAAQQAAADALWEAQYAAWKAQCTPGESVPVQHGNQVVTWVC